MAKPNARTERREARKRLGMKHGQVVNLATLFKNKLLTGGMIPSEIRELPSISMGSKVLFSALLERQATQRAVFPSIKTLGKDIGVGEKQARKYVMELERFELIRVNREKDLARTRMNKPNRYEFLYHSVYDNVQPGEENSPPLEHSKVPPEMPGAYSPIETPGTPDSGRRVTSAINTMERHQECKEDIGSESNPKRISLAAVFGKHNRETVHEKEDDESLVVADLVDISPEDVSLTEDERATITSWKSRSPSVTYGVAFDSEEWRRELKAALLTQGVTIAHLGHIVTFHPSSILICGKPLEEILLPVAREFRRRYSFILHRKCLTCFDTGLKPDRSICSKCGKGQERLADEEKVRARRKEWKSSITTTEKRDTGPSGFRPLPSFEEVFPEFKK